MIKRAKTVYLMTVGYACRVTVENSVMTARKLRRILLKYGGEDKGDCCWFENRQQYWKVLKELSEGGAHIDIQ